MIRARSNTDGEILQGPLPSIAIQEFPRTLILGTGYGGGSRSVVVEAKVDSIDRGIGVDGQQQPRVM